MNNFDFQSLTDDLIVVAIGILIVVVLNFIKFHKASAKVLHRRYLIQLVQLVLIAYCIIRLSGAFNPDINIRSIFLAGSAIIVTVIGFAGQTAISDILCGFLISIFKPFEIGDRIVIEGMEPGIVEDITLRHIVVGIYDNIKIIVPHSQLNEKTLINTSYHNTERRGIHLQFSVSYDTDVQKAMDIIRDCVAESPYTLHVVRNGVSEDSGPVYFLKFDDSALILETTIWVTKETSSYIATTDINLRVNKAFNANGIEIPYNYLNVIDVAAVTAKKQAEDAALDGDKKKEKKNSLDSVVHKPPAKRLYRTNNIRIIGDLTDIDRVKELAASFARKQRLTLHNARQLELISEEAVLMIHSLMGEVPVRLWIDGSGILYRVHLTFDAQVGSEEYKKLIGLSSAGKNDAISGITGRIFEAMILGIDSLKPGNPDYEWKLDKKSMTQEELSGSILGAVAGEIKVGVTKDFVELTIENKQES